MRYDENLFTFGIADASEAPLFITLPDTDFRDFLDEISAFAASHPDIIAAINADQDRAALEKKQLREADKNYAATADLPMQGEKSRVVANVSMLKIGRPRTPAFLVFILYMLKGFLGSVSDKQATRLMRESISLHRFLIEHHLRLPAETTMIENTNHISTQTQELIFKRQIEDILNEGLDDFRKLTIDSTGVIADTAWPTDGKTLIGLINRAYCVGRKLSRFGLADFVQGHLPRWICEMNAIEFKINLAGGKKDANRTRKKLYGKLLKKGEKAVKALEKEFAKKVHAHAPTRLPSQLIQLDRIIEQLRNDLADARDVLDYTHQRIFEGKTLPASEKILSLSDGSAAYISKGGREPIIGYKPQVTRSANGFVVDLTVPEGNAADSAQFVPCIQRAMARTGVIAELVSSDDGYSSKASKETLEESGVKIVSISGSKGKKITDPEDWDSEAFRKARNDRSAVESLMFTLKDGFEFGRLSRRGIDAARSELISKVLAYNFCRKIEIRSRQAEQLQLTG